MTRMDLAQLFIDNNESVEAALLEACATILKMLPATSMGMLRCGKKARDIDSEYGGK